MRNTLDLDVCSERELENRYALVFSSVCSFLFLSAHLCAILIVKGTETYSPHRLGVRREEFRIHLVDSSEVLHVRQEHLHHDAVIDRATGGLEDGGEVGEALSLTPLLTRLREILRSQIPLSPSSYQTAQDERERGDEENGDDRNAREGNEQHDLQHSPRLACSSWDPCPRLQSSRPYPGIL
jgi:hypothetical protein